jgi:hypothetical protein
LRGRVGMLGDVQDPKRRDPFVLGHVRDGRRCTRGYPLMDLGVLEGVQDVYRSLLGLLIVGFFTNELDC